jgi:hypothetical protein
LKGQAGYAQAQADYAAAHANDYQVIHETPSGETVIKGFPTQAKAQAYADTLPKASVTYTQPGTGKSETAYFQSEEQAKGFSDVLSTLKGKTTQYYVVDGKRYPFSERGREAAFTETNKEINFSGTIPGGGSISKSGAGLHATGLITFGGSPTPESKPELIFNQAVPFEDISPTGIGAPIPSFLKAPDFTQITSERGVDFEAGVESIAGGFRGKSAEIFSFGETLKAKGDLGAIPVFIGANLVRAGAGVVEAISFPFRPLQWINTAKTFLTPEGRGGLVKSFQQDPMGSVMELGGGLLGSYALGEAVGAVRSTFSDIKNPVAEVSAPEGFQATMKRPLKYETRTPLYSEVGQVKGFKVSTLRGYEGGGEVNIPVLRGILSRELVPSEARSLYDISGPAPDTLVGFSEGYPVEVFLGEKTLSKIAKGETVIGRDVGVNIKEIGGTRYGFMGADSVDDFLRAENLKTFKEVGADTRWTLGAETKLVEPGGDFAVDVIGGAKIKSPPIEISEFKIEAIPGPKSSLTKAFGMMESGITKKITAPIKASEMKIVSELTGVEPKISPITRVSEFTSDWIMPKEVTATGPANPYYALRGTMPNPYYASVPSEITGIALASPGIMFANALSALEKNVTIERGKNVEVNLTRPAIIQKPTISNIQAPDLVSNVVTGLKNEVITSQRITPINIQVTSPITVSQQIEKVSTIEAQFQTQRQIVKTPTPTIQMPKIFTPSIRPPTIKPPIIKPPPLIQNKPERKARVKPEIDFDLFGRKRVTYRELDLPTAVFGKRRRRK